MYSGCWRIQKDGNYLRILKFFSIILSLSSFSLIILGFCWKNFLQDMIWCWIWISSFVVGGRDTKVVSNVCTLFSLEGESWIAKVQVCIIHPECWQENIYLCMHACIVHLILCLVFSISHTVQRLSLKKVFSSLARKIE